VNARPSYADLSDQDLLARAAEGEREAFGEVVRRHRDRLWAVALRTMGDPEEAADALQDALVSALRATARARSSSGPAYRGEAAVTTWLHRVVVNACIDRMRRRAARPTSPLPEEGVLPGAPDRIAARETTLVVADALRTLPVEQRAALVLVDMQGWSVADAATVLGVAPGTVKSRCSRGRARLLPLLAELRGSPGNQPPRPDVPPEVPPPGGDRDPRDRTPSGGDQHRDR
jgi:RNA polymerase sigma-70 factor (ECF subfamily)